MRGSNAGSTLQKPPEENGSLVSHDGGHTWSEAKDMRYDTGEQFYSPATIHKTIRSSKTGKLCWIGILTTSLQMEIHRDIRFRSSRLMRMDPLS